MVKADDLGIPGDMALLPVQAGFYGAAHRLARWTLLAFAGLALAHCAGGGKIDPKYGVAASTRVVEPGQPVPKGGGVYRVGKPYVVAGRTFTPEENINYRAEGMASWYGDDFHGRLTANGEVFDMQSISAAHPTMPLPSYARVTNLRNNRSIIVRVNDRGPYVGNRIIDLSVRTAQLLGFHGDGLARVRVEYVGRAPLEGSDDRKLVATLRTGKERAADGPMLASAEASPVAVASGKPFVPEFFDTTPIMNRRHGGVVPVPPERPYTLGEDAGEAPAPTAAETREAARQSSTTEFAASRSLPARAVARSNPPPAIKQAEPPVYSAASRVTSPVSAYAPVRYDNSAGYVSGRGLY